MINLPMMLLVCFGVNTNGTYAVYRLKGYSVRQLRITEHGLICLKDQPDAVRGYYVTQWLQHCLYWPMKQPRWQKHACVFYISTTILQQFIMY
jgi:hypothetical protein